MKLYDNKTVGGVLLIAGTAIGAGMLALPLTTGVGGFFYSTLLILACFSFMLMTLFILLEANLYEESMEANIISMAKKRLGVTGQIAAWFSFLLLLYSVAAAYLSAGGSLIGKVINDEISHQYAQYGIYMFGAFVCTIVFFGAWLIDYLNRFLMCALISIYLVMVLFVSPHVSLSNFHGGEPKYLLGAVTVVALSFTSHIIVPSLRMYMKNNVPQLKRTLLIGSIIPLFFYLVWQFLILGLLPPAGDQFSLKAVASGAHPVASLTHALRVHVGLSWIANLVGAFSFLAVTTSFLAVVLSLVDFLADGLQIKRTFVGKLFLLAFAIVPPLLFALYYPEGFILALSYAGVFVAVLYGILPPLMVYRARYKDKLTSPFVMPGGKLLLLLTILGALVIIAFQVATTEGWLPKL